MSVNVSYLIRVIDKCQFQQLHSSLNDKRKKPYLQVPPVYWNAEDFPPSRDLQCIVGPSSCI